jgi:hypothetical protein
MKTEKLYNWRIDWKVWVLITIIVLVILANLALASCLYAGNTYTYDTDIKDVYWKVEGNSSSLEGLEISHTNAQIILSFDLNFKPDNFTLTFYDNSTDEEVITYDTGGDDGNNGHWVIHNQIANVMQNDSTNDTITSPPEETPQETEGYSAYEIKMRALSGFIVVAIIIILLSWLASRGEKEDTLPEFKDIAERRVEEDE